jgi:hypothetical protein
MITFPMFLGALFGGLGLSALIAYITARGGDEHGH